jgi:hypothetical protein
MALMAISALAAANREGHDYPVPLLEITNRGALFDDDAHVLMT